MIELTKEQIKLKAEWTELMAVRHREWIEHPMTKQFLKNVLAFKEAHVQVLNHLVNDRTCDANFYRAQGMNIKNCDAIIVKMTHTDTFVNDSIPQPKE